MNQPANSSRSTRAAQLAPSFWSVSADGRREIALLESGFFAKARHALSPVPPSTSPPGPDARGERRDHAAAPAARQGRAGNRQDHARGAGRQGARHAAARVAHQVHHQGAAGPVRIRRGEPAARFAAGRRARARHPQLHRQGHAVAGVFRRPAGGAADRRGGQGRHRIPQRPAARARPHGVLRLRDPRTGQGEAAPDRVHHLEQRKRAARRLPAPLFLPLHPLSRTRRRWRRSSTSTIRP